MLLATSFLFIKGFEISLLILAPVVIYQMYDLYRFHQKAFE
jgi:hypothetical protein